MKQRYFLSVVLGVLLSFSACEQDLMTNCRSVSESVYINERYPTRIEQYNPDSARILTFEFDFNDSVVVQAGNNSLAKGYLVTKSNGAAGRLLVKARSNEEITISTTNGCARFKLKDGYKYLYINRSERHKWSIAYSNFGRGYF